MRLFAVIEAESISGPAKNLLEFARLARPNGIDVSIAAFTRGPARNAFIDAARDSALRVHVLSERRAFDLAVIDELRNAAKQAAPDLIQTHAVKSHFLVRWSELAKTARWIAFHHGYTRTAPRVALYNQLDRWSLRAARRVVTVSIPFREELVARGVRRQRIEIVHNAIPADWGLAARAEAIELRSRLGIPPGARVLLSVGRLSREKDHFTLLKALRLLPTTTSVHLLIVGDGPERGRIENAVGELGLGKAVTLTGHQPTAAPYYGIAAVAVLSSRSEGSPNALLEALASRVPAVATRVGGIPEHVQHGESALLVEPGDAAAMASAIAKLTGPDRGLSTRLAERGRALVRDRFSPEARMRRLVEIYASALRNPQQP
jgi:glycosyltransferase involved in cell wall biosynthesis